MTYKQQEILEWVIAIIIFILIILAVFGSIAWISWYQCHSKWDRANMSEVEWGPIQGCMVKMPDGRWLPEERIREFDIPK